MTPTTSSLGRAALAYAERFGWHVLPLHTIRNGRCTCGKRGCRSSGKHPIRKLVPHGLDDATTDPDTIRRWWKARPAANVGIVAGASGLLILDVDPRHGGHVSLEALEGEHGPLPATVESLTGGGGRHVLFEHPGGEIGNSSGKLGSGLDVKANGGYIVAPPSLHKTGRLYEWEVSSLPDEVPLALPPAWLLARHTTTDRPEQEVPRSAPDNGDRRRKCLLAMLKIPVADGSDGSSRLVRVARQCVRYSLPDSEALDVIAEYSRLCPFPRQWNDKDVLRRLRDAEKKATRGVAVRTRPSMGAEAGTAQADPGEPVKLGERDPETDKLVLSPSRTLPTAQAYTREFHTHLEGRTIVTYADNVMVWRGNRYVQVEDATIRNRLQPWLHDALRYAKSRGGKGIELVPFDSNAITIRDALRAVMDHTHLPATVAPPTWLDHRPSAHDPREILPCKTVNLHIPSGVLLPATPALFTTSALTFDYDPNAPVPRRWINFVDQLWGDDQESIDLLQEWIGYSLIPETSQHKMLLIVGPRRSGKGTVGRVLTELVGRENVVGPTTTSLGGTFGLQSLIGKSLAIVSDARFSGENITAVVERLLCISGEDALTIDRKHKPALTMRLPTRFVFLTNEIPRMADVSGALAGRFMILMLTQSFFGREDPGLTEKLLAELPGILLWAIDGWKRLRDRGRFIQPGSVADAVQELEDLGSPVGTFVRECCEVGNEFSVPVGELFGAWKTFCVDMGRDYPGTEQTFGRNLRAVVPDLRTKRPQVDGVRFRTYEGIRFVSFPAYSGTR